MEVKLKVLSVDPKTVSCVCHISTDAFPQGATWNVTIYANPIPSGQALVDYLIARSCGNGDWLEKMGECAQQLPDMSSVKELIDTVQVGSVVTTKERLAQQTKLTDTDVQMVPMDQT